MRKFILYSVSCAALVGYGYGFAALAQSVDYNAKPVFPAQKTAAADAPVQVPAGAQFRIASGKTGFKFVACNESRLVAGTHEERHCVTFSPSKGWGKSLRWIPAYQLLPLR